MVSKEEEQRLAKNWTEAALAYVKAVAPLSDDLEYVPHPYVIGQATIRCKKCDRLQVHPSGCFCSTMKE